MAAKKKTNTDRAQCMAVCEPCGNLEPWTDCNTARAKASAHSAATGHPTRVIERNRRG